MTYELLIAVPILILLVLLIKVIMLQSGRGKPPPVKYVDHFAATQPSTFVPPTRASHPGAAQPRQSSPVSPTVRPSIRPSTIAPATPDVSVDDGGFANSLMLGIATDNTLLATAIGGSLAGAMIGVALDDSMRSSDTPSPAPAVDVCQTDTLQTSSGDASPTCCPDPSPSYDTGSSTDVGSCDAGSSFDTGSSFDSGSSGGW